MEIKPQKKMPTDIKTIFTITTNVTVFEFFKVHSIVTEYIKGYLSCSENKIDRLNHLCYLELGKAIVDGIRVLYDKMRAFPFRKKEEINEVFLAGMKFIDECIDFNSKHIEKYTNSKIDNKELYYKQAIAEIQIGDAILRDQLKKEKAKNTPIFLSGIWGILGAIIGALITVLLSIK